VRRLARSENEAAIAQKADGWLGGAVQPVEILHDSKRIGRPWVVTEAAGAEAKATRSRGKKVTRFVEGSALESNGDADMPLTQSCVGSAPASAGTFHEKQCTGPASR
jgi:hypothetical protein